MRTFTANRVGSSLACHPPSLCTNPNTDPKMGHIRNLTPIKMEDLLKDENGKFIHPPHDLLWSLAEMQRANNF